MCIYKIISHLFYYFQIQVTCHVGGFKKNDDETMPKSTVTASWMYVANAVS